MRILFLAKRKYTNKDAFRERTGLPLASYFSGLKLRWLLDNVPGARVKAERGELRFGTIDSWLVSHLARGQHITDVTNASRTQLMNLSSLAWDEEMLKVFRIPASVLPRIVSSSEVYGEIAHGPLKGVPIAGYLGDQQAAPVGQTWTQRRQSTQSPAPAVPLRPRGSPRFTS